MPIRRRRCRPTKVKSPPSSSRKVSILMMSASSRSASEYSSLSPRNSRTKGSLILRRHRVLGLGSLPLSKQCRLVPRERCALVELARNLSLELAHGPAHRLQRPPPPPAAQLRAHERGRASDAPREPGPQAPRSPLVRRAILARWTFAQWNALQHVAVEAAHRPTDLLPVMRARQLVGTADEPEDEIRVLVGAAHIRVRDDLQLGSAEAFQLVFEAVVRALLHPSSAMSPRRRGRASRSGPRSPSCPCRATAPGTRRTPFEQAPSRRGARLARRSGLRGGQKDVGLPARGLRLQNRPEFPLLGGLARRCRRAISGRATA